MSRVLPILFNTEMVRAILDGRKTVTRRLIKQRQIIGLGCDECPNNLPEEYIKAKRLLFKPYCDMANNDLIKVIYKPPYETGDILYVRETWCWEPCWDCGMDTEEHNCCDKCANKIFNHDKGEWGCYEYKASLGDDEYPSVDTWHPSIHMPKAAARFWLNVTDVRVEQIKDMNLDDFLCEGITLRPEAYNDPENAYRQAKEAFLEIIKQIYPDCTEDSWFWVIEFERCEKPESEKL